MKKIILIVSFLFCVSDGLDWRVMLGAGYGFGYYNPKVSPDSKNIFLNPQGVDGFASSYNIFFASEWIFDKSGNGLNADLEFELDPNILSLGVKYIYETQQTDLKYALLTGFDIGFVSGIPLTGAYLIAQEPITRYNLGVRFRKVNHAVFFNLKIPFYRINFVDNVSNDGVSLYPLSATLSYVYIFGSKN